MGREYPVRTESASQVISQALVEERVTAILASFFAGLALLLASIGLYGLMSHAVTHRAREIGSSPQCSSGFLSQFRGATVQPFH